MIKIEAKNAVIVSQEELAKVFFCPGCPMRQQGCKLRRVCVNEFEPEDLTQPHKYEITHLCDVFSSPSISG